MTAFVVYTDGICASEEAIHSSPDRAPFGLFVIFTMRLQLLSERPSDSRFTFMSSFVTSISSHLTHTHWPLNADPTELKCNKTKKKKHGKLSRCSTSSIRLKTWHLPKKKKKTLRHLPLKEQFKQKGAVGIRLPLCLWVTVLHRHPEITNLSEITIMHSDKVEYETRSTSDLWRRRVASQGEQKAGAGALKSGVQGSQHTHTHTHKRRRTNAHTKGCPLLI